jgi:endonuclease/exonuclease/phosphatase family metal-dependent hydrolase
MLFRWITLGILLACGARARADSEPSAGNQIRVTTWNLEWFPNGSAKDASPEEQTKRINAAADVLRPLNSDILLLQEVKDYDACSRLAEAIKPKTYTIAICSSFKGGRQQEAILAKIPAQAAWYEEWKSGSGIDPPRGFAFAWFQIGNKDIGVYSLHLKSNLIMHGNKEEETAKNIRKREIAIEQLLTHVHDIIGTTIPSIKSLIVGGDFNTNHDQAMFAAEKTLDSLIGARYQSGYEGLLLRERITHPKNHGYPDATFDYLFVNGLTGEKPIIKVTHESDHYPVTRDLVVK